MEKIIDNFFEEDEIFSEGEYKLIFTSVRRGYEGHSGAMVLQAKSVEKSRKRFFGFSVDPESSIVLMIVKSEIVVPVIKSIYSVVDFKSEARGMLFVLPISMVCGLDESFDIEKLN